MAFSLFLQARRKPRLGLDASEGDYTLPKLVAWAGSSLNRDEIAGLISSLQDLLASGASDDDGFDPDFSDKPRGTGPNAGAMDRGRKVTSGFSSRYPTAAKVGRVVYGDRK
jgi:hypothetical protein